MSDIPCCGSRIGWVCVCVMEMGNNIGHQSIVYRVCVWSSSLGSILLDTATPDQNILSNILCCK